MNCAASTIQIGAEGQRRKQSDPDSLTTQITVGDETKSIGEKQGDLFQYRLRNSIENESGPFWTNRSAFVNSALEECHE